MKASSSRIGRFTDERKSTEVYSLNSGSAFVSPGFPLQRLKQVTPNSQKRHAAARAKLVELQRVGLAKT
jgi:hypothetical protein